MVLGASGAAFEVRAHARDLPVRFALGQRELDVAVERLEARLAGQLRARRSDESLRRRSWSAWRPRP